MRDSEYRHAVETAHKFGASIEAEYQHPNGNKYWVACETPRWDWYVGDYRVKSPEPAKPRQAMQFWIATDSLGNKKVYTNPFNISGSRSIVHVREVLQDESKAAEFKPARNAVHVELTADGKRAVWVECLDYNNLTRLQDWAHHVIQALGDKS